VVGTLVASLVVVGAMVVVFDMHENCGQGVVKQCFVSLTQCCSVGHARFDSHATATHFLLASISSPAGQSLSAGLWHSKFHNHPTHSGQRMTGSSCE
jgi:hypothetical protein